MSLQPEEIKMHIQNELAYQQGLAPCVSPAAKDYRDGVIQGLQLALACFPERKS